MESFSTDFLMLSLLVLIVFSGFFSGTETGMMSINRYRLKHLVKSQHKGAKRVSALLERMDRLIGVILIGNNFVNNLAAAIAAMLAARYWGENGVFLATIILTIVMLVFSELTPKTLAAMHPERIAFPASHIIKPLLQLLSPLVFLVNTIANNLLKLLGVKVDTGGGDNLSREELRTVVNEAGALIPQRHQKMLLSILDLEKVTVDDIMIPKSEIAGIDLNDEWQHIEHTLSTCQHTRLLAYEDNLDKVIGFIHVRHALHLLTAGQLDIQQLGSSAQNIYYVPEGTPLNTQLLKFQRKKERIGLVVDEYGDIAGLVTLDDILEEIVGEFTTDFSQTSKDIHPQDDGSFVIDGSAHIRDINKTMGWQFPTDGPKTLSGLIIERMENIPAPGTSIRIAGYPIEIIQVKDNMVKSAQIFPALYRQKSED